LHATTLASLAGLLWKILEFYGQDADALFRSEGLDPDRMRDLNARFRDARVDALWDKAGSLIADPCFGLRAARCWHPSMLGALGYAWLASSTLRTAFGRLERYARLLADVSDIRLTETQAGFTIKLEAPRQQEREIPGLADASLSVLLDMCRVNYGDTLDPVLVSLRREQPPCAGQYFALFRCPVHFSAPMNELILPLEAVDRPLPTSNRQMASLHDQVVADVLARLEQDDIVTRVKGLAIEHLPSGGISEDGAAAALNISTRTLQRRLREGGQSFGQLSESVRQELAMKYILDPGISLGEISYLLGFSEPSSFSRAFRRWTGKTPRKMRQTG
jgi:AraC-like DNA-binding protein